MLAVGLAPALPSRAGASRRARFGAIGARPIRARRHASRFREDSSSRRNVTSARPAPGILFAPSPPSRGASVGATANGGLTKIETSAYIPLSFKNLRALAAELVPRVESGETDPGRHAAVTDALVAFVRLVSHADNLLARDEMKHYVYYHANAQETLGNEQVDLEELSAGPPSVLPGGASPAADASLRFSTTMASQRAAAVDAAEFDALTRRFLAEVCELLRDADFVMLSQREWDLAQAESFLFTLPTEVNWEKLDRDLMRGFLDDRPDVRDTLPREFDESLALFRRGYGIAKAKDRFVPEKIDLLVQMLVVEPFWWILGRPRAVFAEQFEELEDAFEDARENFARETARVSDAARGAAEGLKDALEDATPFRMFPEEEAGGKGAARSASRYSGRPELGGDVDGRVGSRPEMDLGMNAHGVTIERLTLRRLLPTPWAVLANFFAEMEIQEPTYKEVVLLYRMAKPEKGQRAGPTGAGPLIMRSFRDVPVADVDMVFPAVEVTVKSQDLLVNAALAIAALGAVAASFARGFELSKQTLAAVVAVGAKVAQAVAKLFQAKQKYAGLMARAIQTKSADSQMGMLINLMESMEDQECKEMILGFCVLSAGTTTGGAMTVAEVKAEAEKKLLERFGLRVAFDAEKTLERLRRKGLARRSDEGAFESVAVRAALEKNPMRAPA